MSNSMWERLGYWALALLLFIETLLVIRGLTAIVTWSSLDSGWAQALGGLLAFFGALWIYWRQAEEKRKEDLIRAVVAAAHFIPPLGNLTSEVRRVRRDLDAALRTDCGSRVFEHALEGITVPLDWDLTQIQLLAPLPNNCAVNVAQALSSLRAFQSFTHKALVNPRMQDTLEYRLGTARILLRLLAASDGMLHRAGTELQRTLNTNFGSLGHQAV